MRLMFYFCQFEWTPLPTPSPQKHCIAPSPSPSLPQNWLHEKGGQEQSGGRLEFWSSQAPEVWGQRHLLQHSWPLWLSSW